MGADRSNRRVFVTGAGVVSSIGLGVDAFWQGIRDGRCGFRRLETADFENQGPDLPGLECRLAAPIADFDPRKLLGHWQRDKMILHSGRFCWLAGVAAEEAVAMSGLEWPFPDGYRVASIIGSACGGHITNELAWLHRLVFSKNAVHPMTLVRVVGSSAAAHVSIEFGVRGPTFGVASGGASAAHAIALGRDQIRFGLTDVAIVGGTDSTMTSSALLGAQQLGLLSPTGCRPFARDRNGTIIGEGAGCLVLESEEHALKRGATVLGELCGIGMAASGHDMLAVEPEAVESAMRFALSDAGLEPAAIGYLNACGAGTIQGDRAEAEAVRNVFDASSSDVAVSSSKPMHANTLGASGALEAIVCLKALEEGWLPPTPGLADPAPDCALNFVSSGGLVRDAHYAMSNSLAIGGSAMSLIFGRPPA